MRVKCFVANRSTSRTSRLRNLTLIGALLVLASGSPRTALAQDDGSTDFDFDVSGGQVALTVGYLLTGVVSVAFIAVDASYGAQDSWIPPSAAGVQIGLAAVPNLAYGAILVSRDGTLGALGAFNLLLGTWFLTHGVLSLVLYEPPEDADDRGLKPRPQPSVALGLAPRSDGGALVASARF